MGCYVLLFSVTFSILCYVKCCTNASFNNTRMSLKGEGISISTKITGCLTASKQTENISTIHAFHGFMPSLFKDAISNMPDLKEIKFEQMNLRNVERGSLVNLPALRILSLFSNLLRKILQHTFTGLPLRLLELSSNQIYFIESKAFVIDSLVYLGLFDNKIEIFLPDWFDNSNLEVLIMSKNLLSYIPENAFVNLGKLKVLNFQMNRITYIHKDAFKILPVIEMIDLSCNRIKNLDSNLFTFTSGGGNLTNLYLNSNSLTYLPKQMLNKLSNLRVFSFHGNPWQCPCFLFIKNWTQNNNIYHYNNALPRVFNKVPNCVFSITYSEVCSQSVDEEIVQYYQPFENVDCKKFKYRFSQWNDRYLKDI